MSFSGQAVAEIRIAQAPKGSDCGASGSAESSDEGVYGKWIEGAGPRRYRRDGGWEWGVYV